MGVAVFQQNFIYKNRKLAGFGPEAIWSANPSVLEYKNTVDFLYLYYVSFYNVKFTYSF